MSGHPQRSYIPVFLFVCPFFVPLPLPRLRLGTVERTRAKTDGMAARAASRASTSSAVFSVVITNQERHERCLGLRFALPGGIGPNYAWRVPRSLFERLAYSIGDGS